MMPAESRASALRLLAVLLIGSCAWMTTFGQIGWIADDHWDVYGQPERPIPSFHDMVRDAGLGKTLPHPTIERILALPFCGYLGLWLGPQACHLLLGVMHLACGVGFYMALRQLRWGRSISAWAAMIFLVSPWVAEPIFWWTAGTLATPSTLLGLGAVLAYLHRIRGGSRWFLGLTLLLTFACNCWYELWLALPLLFLGIEIYERRSEATPWAQTCFQSLARCWPTALPGALWAILAHFTYPDRKVFFPPHRWINVLLSVQLRVFNWFSLTPWRSAMQDGIRTLLTPLGIVLLVLTMSALILKFRASPGMSDDSPPIPLVPALLLGWLWFMSARLVLVLQGGIDVETRHNYPANMGCIIAALAIFDALRRRMKINRATATFFLGAAVLIGMLTTAGIGKQYASLSASEKAVAR